MEKLEYEFIPQNNLGSSIDGITKGELDVVIGPINITSDHLGKVALTQPYFLANIGLLIAAEKPTVWSRGGLVYSFLSSFIFILVEIKYCHTRILPGIAHTDFATDTRIIKLFYFGCTLD